MKSDQFILICSDEKESTTDEVCLWLNHLNKSFIRISCKDRIIITKVLLDDDKMDVEFRLTTREELFYLSQISSYWYRRSYLRFEQMNKVKHQFEGIEVGDELTKELVKEYDVVKTFFELKLNELAKLNVFDNNNINKLNALDIARKVGLKIPNSIIAKEKKDLKLLNPKKEYITKSIGDFRFEVSPNSYSVMTNEIDINQLNQTNLFYSLIQEQVPKIYELRIFYAFDKFYSTAIFSQGNEKTKIDFRNYDFDKPNIVVPYQLPTSIEEKLKLLMKTLGLKSGSIDIAYKGNNNYTFFEVNPVGQFEQVTLPANYNLFRMIAMNL